jgi:hypothetical protein
VIYCLRAYHAIGDAFITIVVLDSFSFHPSSFCHRFLSSCFSHDRNMFYRIDCQEVVECPYCSEAYPLEDLMQKWLVTREPIVCAVAKQPVPFDYLLPEFYLEHNGLRVSPNYKTLPGKLGEGAFGVVNRGMIIEGSLAQTEVAIKTFKVGGTRSLFLFPIFVYPDVFVFCI